MSYVDAVFDRDQDIIRVVERKDGKRHFHEYQAKYTFYYEDPRGKYKSIYGDPLTRIVCKNTKDFRKEVAINKNKNLFESDINPIFQCLSENYLNQDAPKLNIAFFDIETHHVRCSLSHISLTRHSDAWFTSHIDTPTNRL